MGLFAKAGKKFEETKRAFMNGTDTESVCSSCDEPLEEHSERCPHCGEPRSSE